MSTFDALVEQIWGPKAIEPHSGETIAQATRLKLLDVIAQSAFSNLRAYSNCCRSTLWAIQTHIRVADPGTIQACSTMSGGIAGTGETCGAVLGGLMAIGLALGSDGYHHVERDLQARTAARTFVASFTQIIGSTRCYGVQESLIGWICDEASKTEAWHDANGPIGCAAACGLAARLAAEHILQQMAPLP